VTLQHKHEIAFGRSKIADSFIMLFRKKQNKNKQTERNTGEKVLWPATHDICQGIMCSAKMHVVRDSATL
jgi:hypothetical protein